MLEIPAWLSLVHSNHPELYLSLEVVGNQVQVQQLVHHLLQEPLRQLALLHSGTHHRCQGVAWMSVLPTMFSLITMALRRLSTRNTLNICFLASLLRSLFGKAFQWALRVRIGTLAFLTGLACLGIWGIEYGMPVASNTIMAKHL